MSDQHGYSWGALSPNDPAQTPMRFATQEQADGHAARMTEHISSWDDPESKFWNRDHWKVRPEPWQVKPL